MLLIRDVTSLMRYEKARNVNRLQKMLTNTVSHEMMAPLNTTRLISEVLLEEISNTQHQKMLRQISSASKILTCNVQDLLDRSMTENGTFTKKIERFSLQDAVMEIVELVQMQSQVKNIECKAKFQDNVPDEIEGDQRRLQQVLLNLLTNACKFTPFGGQIKILCKFDSTGHGGKPQIKISVKDTGCGISPQDQQKLFKPFAKLQSSSQLNPNGIGLGLSICKSICIGLGGNIQITSSKLN